MPAATLRLADAAMLDAFRAWRVDQGDSTHAATLRHYAARTFLALRDSALSRDQA